MIKAIQDYIDTQVMKAKAIIMAGQEYPASLFQVWQKEGALDFEAEIVNVFLGNELLKRLLVSGFHAKAHIKAKAGIKLLCVFMLSDSFVTSREIKPESLDKPYKELHPYEDTITPSGPPERKEGILAAVQTKDSSTVTFHLYTRKDSHISFSGTMQESELGVGGRFSNFFPPDLK